MVLGELGVWTLLDSFSGEDAVAFVRRIEARGYSALWLPEAVGCDPFNWIAFLAGQTERLSFATGIVNIYARDPMTMKANWKTLSRLAAGRFVLGVGGLAAAGAVWPLGLGVWIPRELAWLEARGILLPEHHRPRTVSDLPMPVDLPEVLLGEEVVLLGSVAGERVRPEDLVSEHGCAYEVTSLLSPRLPRVYVGEAAAARDAQLQAVERRLSEPQVRPQREVRSPRR